MKKYSIITLVVFLCACQNSPKTTISVSNIETPCTLGGESHLSVNGNDDLIMSWIEEKNDSTHCLLMSKLVGNSFGQSYEVASGNNWFVNWADFPSVVSYTGNSNHLAAHWLQKSSKGTYDYDVMISQSKDGGIGWSQPFVLHTDGISAEHGFVSLSPIGEDRIHAIWLDGRNTKVEDDLSTDELQHSGSMTLRACEFDIDNNRYHEEELDHRVCECCQTDLTISHNQTPLVVYRDRSDTEVRDIFIKRKVKDRWMTSKPVWSEGWYVPGCPVNGPAIASSDSLVAVAWYTESAQTPKVQISFSTDNGSEFSKPIQVDNGNPVGRVDLVFQNDKTAWISWIERAENKAELRLAKINQAKKVEDHFICDIDENRKSGFPILEKSNGNLYVSFTEINGDQTRVRLKKIKI